MKSKWLKFAFDNLKDRIRDAFISEKKKNAFNKALFNIYEAIEIYETLGIEDLEAKREIYSMIIAVEKSLKNASENYFSSFYNKSI